MLGHEHTVGQDGTHDEHAEERMYQNLHSRSAHGVEGAEDVQGVGGTEPEDGLALVQHDEGLLSAIERVQVFQGFPNELSGRVAIEIWQLFGGLQVQLGPGNFLLWQALSALL